MNTAEPLEAAYCRTCGKPVMNATPQQIAQGTVFCEQHSPVFASAASGYGSGTAAGASAVPPSPWVTGTAPPMPASGISPGLAFLLGIIPGVGAVYNGQYAKGLIHAVVTGLLISILSSGRLHGMEPLFGLLLGAWFFYMPFEAYHTAKRREMGQPVDEFSSIVPIAGSGARSPVGPLLLIGFGVLFLLNNLDILNFDAIIRYWPVLLIVLGAYLLYMRISQQDIAAEVDRERQ